MFLKFITSAQKVLSHGRICVNLANVLTRAVFSCSRFQIACSKPRMLQPMGLFLPVLSAVLRKGDRRWGGSAEKSRLYHNHHALEHITWNTLCARRIPRSTHRPQCSGFRPCSCEKRERESAVLAGIVAKCRQNPTMKQHLLSTTDKLFFLQSSSAVLRKCCSMTGFCVDLANVPGRTAFSRSCSPIAFLLKPRRCICATGDPTSTYYAPTRGGRGRVEPFLPSSFFFFFLSVSLQH